MTLPDSPFLALTARQRELVAHLVTGESHAQVALLMGLSPLTVRSYLERIYEVTLTDSVLELAQLCTEWRLRAAIAQGLLHWRGEPQALDLEPEPTALPRQQRCC